MSLVPGILVCSFKGTVLFWRLPGDAPPTCCHMLSHAVTAGFEVTVGCRAANTVRLSCSRWDDDPVYGLLLRMLREVGLREMEALVTDNHLEHFSQSQNPF